MKKILLALLLCPSLAFAGLSAGGGDALTTNTLSQFAATSSSQFKGVINDENAPDGASSKVLMALGSLSIASGKTGTFSNTLTLAGTDSTTMTFPSTSATIARTDAANTFTGVQTMTAPAISGGTHTAITGLGIRSTGAAFDLTLASSEVLTAGRTLSISMGDAARTLTLSGNPTLSGITTTGTGTLALGTKTLTASNTLTLAGTDSTTMTFPTTSATIARTDAANTFTGTQTFSGLITGATGTTALAPLNLPAGTLKTTSAAGDIESDANTFYASSEGGNRGYISPHYIIRADSTVTYTSDTNPHAIFTTPTNGRITLATGTYRFKGLLAFTSMSATSGNLKIDVLGAGTATVGSWLWQAAGLDSASAQSGSIGGSWSATSASPSNIISSQTATAVIAMIDGTFEVTGSGTLIPSQTQTTASAAVLSVGSFIEIWRVGSTSMTSVGAWD